MPKRLCLLMLSALVLVGTRSYSQNLPQTFVPGEFIVGFYFGVNVETVGENIVQSTGISVEVLDSFVFINALYVRLIDATPDGLREFRTTLARNPAVRYVEPNYVYYANGKYPTPQTDPDLDKLWFLSAIGVEEAWKNHEPSGTIIVAVLDGGIMLNHEDIGANLWENPHEVAGDNIDNDKNGYIDDFYGYNFCDNNANLSPVKNSLNRYETHGTHVCGTIGAAGRNSKGIAGISWRVRLMPLRILSPDGKGTAADAVAAIDYAIAQQVDIMNLSWGGYKKSQALFDALSRADTANILVVASSGNDNLDTDKKPHYPSGYDLPNIISVTGTNKYDNNLSPDANYGKTSIDLGAPGHFIFSSIPGTPSNKNAPPTSRYQYNEGTSMAAAVVTGASAFLKSYLPSLKPEDTIRLLLKTVTPKSYLMGKTSSGGQINLQSATSTKPLFDWLEDYIKTMPEEQQQRIKDDLEALTPTEQRQIFVNSPR